MTHPPDHPNRTRPVPALDLRNVPTSPELEGRDVTRLALVADLASGALQFRESVAEGTAVPAEGVLPDGFTLLREDRCDGLVVSWATGPGGAVLVETYSRSTQVSVAAVSRHRLEDLVRYVRGRLAAARPHRQEVEVRVWRQSNDARARHRRLPLTPWAQMAGNYPGHVGRHLAELMRLRPPVDAGQLLLWHGESGTGKTRAVLALMSAWADWCTPHVISDPERMFEDADYLLDVLDGGGVLDCDEPDDDCKWSLVVCEDADEYLRSDARHRSGPALGRLLNATDGLIGRASRALVLLTTNDEIGRLHPAVIRPGRCLAAVQFRRFTGSEAAQWLGPDVPAPAAGASLAELYHLRHGGDRAGVGVTEPVPVGGYV